MAKNKQNGIAMLMIVIVLALTISIYYFSTVSVVDIQNDNALKTQAELKRAKQALLDYALINWRKAGEGGKIGKLPCADSGNINPEGEQEPTCGAAYANAIGYLPWGTLGIDAPKDSSASCFLYVVSPAYKLSPVAALNPNSYGQIQIVDSTGAIVQGVSPEDRPVAVIIAPGDVLAGQARVYDENSICGLDYVNIPAEYLDNDGTTDNAALAAAANNVIDVLVNSYAGSEDWNNPSPLNDQLITITNEELWDVMDSSITDAAFNTRMDNLTEAIALCLAAYGNNNGGNLPMPAELDLNGNDYRNDFSYDDSGVFTSGFSGRLPYDISQANIALPAPAGPANDDKLFLNTVCDDIDLVTGAYNNINFNDDSGDDQGEFFDLWRNWKDHFFYAIAGAHKPDTVVAPCAGNCVRVNGTDYAGVVFFSGHKQAGQQRYAPPFDGALAVDGVDDKDDVTNYLENGNDILFPDNVGNQVYFPVAPPSNDIMFCITPAMTVNRC